MVFPPRLANLIYKMLPQIAAPGMSAPYADSESQKKKSLNICSKSVVINGVIEI